MSDPAPDLAPEPRAPARASKAKAAFAFLDNTSERLVMLHRVTGPSPSPGVGAPTESTAVGRGLNWIRTDYIDANSDGLAMFGLHAVDPTKASDGEIPRMLQRCTSRQALVEWRKAEKRPRVVEQITARLSSTLAPPPSEDE